MLMLLAGNMGNAEVTIDALSIWYNTIISIHLSLFKCASASKFFEFSCPFSCSQNISGWALMISFGFLAAARYNSHSFSRMIID